MRKVVVIFLLLHSLCYGQVINPVPFAGFFGYQGVYTNVENDQPIFGFVGFPGIATGVVAQPMVTSGIVAWWLSTSNITLNSTTVSHWVDVVGGFDLLQATTASQPSYTLSDANFNGYSSLTFTTAQSLDAGNILNIGTQAGQTVIIVFKNLNAGLTFRPVSKSGLSLTNGDYGVDPITTTMEVFYQDAGGARVADPSTTATNESAVVVNVIDRTAGFLTGYKNNSSASTAINTALTNFTPTSTFNVNGVSTRQGNITVLEIIVYNRALSVGEVAQDVNFLRAKYRI